MTAGQQWKRLGGTGGTKFQLAKSVARKMWLSVEIIRLVNSVAVSRRTGNAVIAYCRSWITLGETTLAERYSAPPVRHWIKLRRCGLEN